MTAPDGKATGRPRGLRVSHEPHGGHNGTFLWCDRGLVASMEAGAQAARDADAALIVAAVNEREALLARVERLEAALAGIKSVMVDLLMDARIVAEIPCDAHEAARLAISAARSALSAARAGGKGAAP